MNAELFKSIIVNEKLFPEKLEKKQGRLLVGQAVRQELEPEEKLYIAQQIHTELTQHPERMRPLEVNAILESMNKSRFVLRLGDKNELLGCAQVWPMDSAIVEVGTWISKKHEDYENGSGALVMKHAAQLANAYFDTSLLVVALVHEKNDPAQEALKKLGGIDIGWRPSDYVKDNSAPAKMRVINLRRLITK